MDQPVVGKTHGRPEINLGGFSVSPRRGMTRDGKLKFITHTDRSER
jgi:hypothetical protein